MPARAQDGTCLADRVKLAIPICRAAQRQCPRTGPGRPPTFEDWQIAVLILVAVLNRRKSKSAQYRFLHKRRKPLKGWLRLRRFPRRSTYFGRRHHAAQARRRGRGRREFRSSRLRWRSTKA